MITKSYFSWSVSFSKLSAGIERAIENAYRKLSFE